MFEYNVVEYKQPKFMEEGINKMAKEGWRAVSTACWHNALVTMVVTSERKNNNFFYFLMLKIVKLNIVKIG